MTVKIGTIRVERNRAIQGQRDMRKTNRDLVKQIAHLERQLAARDAEVAKLAALLKEGREIVGEIGAELVAREQEIAELEHYLADPLDFEKSTKGLSE